jgi:hypothetical protein
MTLPNPGILRQVANMEALVDFCFLSKGVSVHQLWAQEPNVTRSADRAKYSSGVLCGIKTGSAERVSEVTA